MQSDRLFGYGEFTAIASAYQGVLFSRCADELSVVCPLPLDELELPVKVRPDKGEEEAAVYAVVLLAFSVILWAVSGRIVSWMHGAEEVRK